MDNHLLELADVVRRFGETYRMEQDHPLLPSQAKALADIAACRTAAMGGHRYRCQGCGETFWVYHGCRNRACPACHGRQTREWLEKRQAQLLPCGYYHVIATAPASIRGAFLADQKAMYSLFMKTVAKSVMDLARDPRFVGATPGILMVLQTWTGELGYHPHVHLLVTAGGVTEDGQHWRAPKSEAFLVPVKALSSLIRGRFRDALSKRHPQVFPSIPASAWARGWNTFCKPCGHGADAVLRYLARYVFRIAITRSRLVDMDDSHVTFRHKDGATGAWRRTRVPGVEFLRRFVMHVLPKGFHKVRYYGLWHHSKRRQQHALRLLESLSRPCSASAPAEIGALATQAEALAAADPSTPGDGAFRPTCPHCGCERVVAIAELKRGASP